MIVNCKCSHEGQDKLHGANRRVANLTLKTEGSRPVVRCTVCASLQSVGSDNAAPSSKKTKK